MNDSTKSQTSQATVEEMLKAAKAVAQAGVIELEMSYRTLRKLRNQVQTMCFRLSFDGALEPDDRELLATSILELSKADADMCRTISKIHRG